VKPFALISVLVAALLLAASAAADTAPQPQTSSNWSGYAIGDPDTIAGNTPASPFTFSNVTATWKQPKVKCTAGVTGYAAFWVGIGGYTDGSAGLEQTGTDSDCPASGKPTYFAWYELVPAPSTRVSLKVNPGDTITASVVVNGNSVLVQVKDRTRKTSFTKHLFTDAIDVTSAEWIAEAPAICTTETHCRVLPLANFGTVTFTNIAATGSSHPGTLSDPSWSTAAIKLIPGGQTDGIIGSGHVSSTAGAQPSAMSADGRSFSVGWLANATNLGG
jgi:hypothetical protein